MKILNYNIQYGAGINRGYWEYFLTWKYFEESQSALESMSKKIKKLSPDVLALTEIDIGSRSNQLEYFSDENSHTYAECKYHTSFNNILTKLPYLKNQCNAILSKNKIIASKNHLFTRGMKRSVIEVVVKKDVSILLTHLDLIKQTRVHQLTELANIVNNISNSVILAGDLNTTPESSEFREFMKKTGLKNALPDNEPTFPSWKPTSCVDYILASEDLKIKNAKVLNWKNSDHLPVFAEIS